MKVYGLKNGPELLGYRCELFGRSYDIDVSSGVSFDSYIPLAMTLKDGYWYSDTDDDVVEVAPNSVEYRVLTTLFASDSVRLVQDFTQYANLHSRSYVEELVRALRDECNIALIKGVRRTGKTVSLYHTAQTLVSQGVDPEKIAFITLSENCSLTSSQMHELIKFLCRGASYVLVDELTYLKAELGFTSLYSKLPNKFVFSGTDTLSLSIVEEDALFDRARVYVSHFISPSEFYHLTGKSTIIEYIESGGILSPDAKYLLDHEHPDESSAKFLKYMFLDRLDHCFKHMNVKGLGKLQDIYALNNWSCPTALLNSIQDYLGGLSIARLSKEILSADLGGLPDLLGRRGIDFDSTVYQELFRKEFDVEGRLYVTSTLFDEFEALLEKLNCYFVKGENVAFFAPIALRYSCYRVCDRILRQHFRGSSEELTIADEVMNNTLQGVLLEASVYIEMVSRGLSIDRYPQNGDADVDMFYNGSFYEIKRSSQILAQQCRWILSPKLLSKYKPQSLNVLYLGSNQVVQLSERDVMKARAANSRNITDEMIMAADDTKYSVNYINVDSFFQTLPSPTGPVRYGNCIIH